MKLCKLLLKFFIYYLIPNSTIFSRQKFHIGNVNLILPNKFLNYFIKCIGKSVVNVRVVS